MRLPRHTPVLTARSASRDPPGCPAICCARSRVPSFDRYAVILNEPALFDAPGGYRSPARSRSLVCRLGCSRRPWRRSSRLALMAASTSWSGDSTDCPRCAAIQGSTSDQRHRLDQALGGLAGPAQALHDARRLAVERHGPAGPRVEDRHAHGRGLDEGLQVGPGPGDAPPERLVLPPQLVGTLQGSHRVGPARLDSTRSSARPAARRRARYRGGGQAGWYAWRAYFGRGGTSIPAEVEHRFRRKWNTDSGKWNTDFGMWNIHSGGSGTAVPES